MRRMEKQITQSFQSGILIGFVCVTRCRQCLTGLKEIFSGQTTDMSIECRAARCRANVVQIRNVGTHQNYPIFPLFLSYLC